MPCDIRAVLLIPHHDHARLLDEGPCGARPPKAMALRLRDGNIIELGQPARWLHWDEIPDSLCAGTNAETMHLVNAPRALVLAWDGLDIWQGCTAANRARLKARAPAVAAHVAQLVQAVLRHGRWHDGACLTGELACIGRIALLGADGREVADDS